MRLSKLRKEIQEVDGFLVSNLPNIRYLIGFTGSSGALLVTQNEAIFFTDFRYKEQSQKEVKGAEIFIIKKSLFPDLVEHPVFSSLKKVGFERQISYLNYETLKNNLKGKKLLPLNDKIENLRKIKDADEIKNIKNAARIADSSFKSIKPLIKPYVTESEIALELDYQMRKRGAQGSSFTTIIASGSNAALPHARSSNKKLKQGETLIIDFGAVYNGYCSDMTRTLILGENQKADKIYKIVLKAQETALNFLKPGISLKKLDKVARDVITKAGYGEYFGHSLGHGVGLEVHESPRVSQQSEDYAKPGMVFTIEPGIYIPDFGGVRIEDMVVMSPEGYEIVTHSPK
ncbi:aminopeptidase P family protein [candidate division WOR-3 bacterium]|nr:aminopeptidase P family protein [candidate division WOR-3 bacterium]